jgi:Ca2+/Na+ antiporter
MSEQQPSESKVLLVFATFFERALNVIKSPFMKFAVVLVAVILLALFIAKDSTSPNVGLVVVALVVLVVAFLAFALESKEIASKEKQLRYARRTEEELKKALREVVMELQAQKASDVSTAERSKYEVHVHTGQGVAIGDHSEVEQTFDDFPQPKTQADGER